MAKKKKKRKKIEEIGYCEIWDSGLEILRGIKIKIPLRLLIVCNSIQKQLSDNYEFTILAKGQWTREGFVISEEYIIPEQEVRRASVEYLEDLFKYRQQGYNVIIHSHPFNMHEFSIDDEETINTHFDCSVLYSQRKFVKAVVTIKVSDNIVLQLEGKTEIDWNTYEEVDISKIKKQEIPKRFYYDYLRDEIISRYRLR